MREEYDAHALVQRYELMLAEDTRYFFDLGAFEQIIDHYKDLHKFEEALNATELALEQYPFAEELKFERAQMLVYSNRLADAKEAIEDIENNHLVTCEVLILKATLYMRYGDYHNAVIYLSDALENAPDPDEIHYRIGYAHQQLRQYREASKEYKKAIRLNPELTHAVHELNECLDITGELESHVSFFVAFTDENPFSPVAWYNLGLIYSKLERWEDALQAFDYATLSEKEFTMAYREAGNVYMNLGDYNAAQQQYTQALEYEDEPDTYLLCALGAAYERMNDFEAALINYKEALRLDKASEDAYYGIVCCLVGQMRWYEAIMYLRKLLHLNPENEEYWIFLGDTEYQLGNVLGAIEAYEKANAIFGQNPRLWLNWSFLYLEQGGLERAYQIIEQGVAECPEDANLYYRAVTYYLCSGKFNEAMDKLEIALSLDYEGHAILYDAFPDKEAQKTISRIIQQIQDNEL
jgi:tetratricopeptide (TPR) repeat protein